MKVSRLGTLLLFPILSLQAQSPGASLFREKGCAQCHSLAGAGGHKGPPLDGVGKRLKKPQIERQILTGGLTMPPFSQALTPDELQTLAEFLHRARKELRPPR